ncbi:hypothetical protein [Amycolatopsis sp. RTGN1]|nr:hypothetical protein [Amycolatopsis sp. RTGN1]
MFGLVLGISCGFYNAQGANLVIEAVPPGMHGVSTELQSFAALSQDR